MTTNYDKAFSAILFDGLNTAEQLNYLSHDQAQELQTIISDYLYDLEINEPSEEEKLVDHEMAMGTEGL